MYRKAFALEFSWHLLLVVGNLLSRLKFTMRKTWAGFDELSSLYLGKSFGSSIAREADQARNLKFAQIQREIILKGMIRSTDAMVLSLQREEGAVSHSRVLGGVQIKGRQRMLATFLGLASRRSPC